MLDWIKLPERYIWMVVVVSGSLLFLPEAWLKTLRVETFSKTYGPQLGLIFLCSFGLSVVNAISRVWNKNKTRKHHDALKRNRIDSLNAHLNRLDHQEQAVLREFWLQGQNAIKLPIDNPTVAGLRAKGILIVTGNLGQASLAGMLFPARMADDVAEKIGWDQIGLPSSGRQPNQEEQQWLKNNRPTFMREILEQERLFRGLW